MLQVVFKHIMQRSRKCSPLMQVVDSGLQRAGHQDHTSTAGLRGLYKRWATGLHLRLHKVTAATLPGISVSHSWPRPTCQRRASLRKLLRCFLPTEAAHEILHSFDETALVLCLGSWALTFLFNVVNGEDLTCG